MPNTYVVRDGVRLFVRDFGGDGPPLVMLHSTGFGHWMWEPHARELSRRFHVYAPDQRGHGDSDKVSGFAFDNLARDMQAVFDALALERPYAAGHSAGATTLAVHAALFPGRIQRLLMVEPVLPRGRMELPPSDQYLAPNAMAERTRRRRSTFESAQEMYEGFRGRPPFNTWTEESLRLYCEQGTTAYEGGINLKCAPELEARFYEAVADFDAAPALSGVRCPVRLLWGETGNRGMMGAVNGAGQLIPGARERTIAGATHFLPMEKPEVVVAEALDLFLGKDASYG